MGLLVSLTVSAFVATGLMGLAYLNSSSNVRVMNKCDSVNATRTAVDQISTTVRSARCVGSMWTSQQVNQTPPVDYSMLASGTSTNTSAIHLDLYPSQSKNATASTAFPTQSDPYYGTTPITGTGVPEGGWPSLAGWQNDSNLTDPSSRWRCTQTCLIIQVPVFDSNGIPLALSSNIPVIDTIVYRVMPDTAADAQANTFKMERAIFAAPNVPRPAGYSTTAAPQTILRGIIGPFDPSGNGSLRIFQYLSNAAPGTPCFEPTSADLATVGGISINIEVLRQEAGASQQAALQFKGDVYMRNNIAFTN